MRLHFGNVPGDATAQAGVEQEGLRPIRGPGSRLGVWLAGLTGFLLFMLLFVGLTIMSFLAARSGWRGSGGDGPLPWGAMLLVFLLYIPVHELLHAVCHPGLGLSSNTVAIIWPTRLRFGVYYEGCMSRRRWLGMRLAPFAALSLLPAGLLALSHGLPMSFSLLIGLQVLMLVNTLGSGGDVLAVFLVLRQVPPRAALCFRGGQAYWRAAKSSAL